MNIDNNNISRFCQVIANINNVNNSISIAKKQYYDGGSSFDASYSYLFVELEKYQTEFKQLFATIHNIVHVDHS